MSFDPANEKQSVFARESYGKHESSRISVKSARKAKDMLHNPFKERQKLVSELCTGINKTECAWHASMSHESVIDF